MTTVETRAPTGSAKPICRIGLVPFPDFGELEAASNRPSTPADYLPGSTVYYTCLSHDLVAHEPAHAILDGVHRRYEEPSNPGVLAFREGFDDPVALMQHFALPEIVEREHARTRGALDAETALSSLAVEFGRAVARRGALREAIVSLDDDGVRRLHASTEARSECSLGTDDSPDRRSAGTFSLRYEGPEHLLGQAAQIDRTIEWEGRCAHRAQACLRLHSDPGAQTALRRVLSSEAPKLVAAIALQEGLLRWGDVAPEGNPSRGLRFAIRLCIGQRGSSADMKNRGSGGVSASERSSC